MPSPRTARTIAGMLPFLFLVNKIQRSIEKRTWNFHFWSAYLKWSMFRVATRARKSSEHFLFRRFVQKLKSIFRKLDYISRIFKRKIWIQCRRDLRTTGSPASVWTPLLKLKRNAHYSFSSKWMPVPDDTSWRAKIDLCRAASYAHSTCLGEFCWSPESPICKRPFIILPDISWAEWACARSSRVDPSRVANAPYPPNSPAFREAENAQF